MGSPPRIEEVGAIYHANTVAVAGLKAFPDSYHRDVFMQMFGLELELSGWECLAYTVLGTHYHATIRLTKLTLSSGFQRLNSRYARWFNAEHRRRGALWQSRFFDVVVETELHLLEQQRYIAWNAPRAGLADRPEDWPHCGYGALIGLYPPDPWIDEEQVLAAFGSTTKRARARLRAFVEERDPRVRRALFLRGTQRRAVGLLDDDEAVAGDAHAHRRRPAHRLRAVRQRRVDAAHAVAPRADRALPSGSTTDVADVVVDQVVRHG